MMGRLLAATISLINAQSAAFLYLHTARHAGQQQPQQEQQQQVTQHCPASPLLHGPSMHGDGCCARLLKQRNHPWRIHLPL